MFQLIVAVISIALVAALAIASIFYGGSAFSSSSESAGITAFVNAGQQLGEAQKLYMVENGTTASEPAHLVPRYLASMPAVPSVGDRTGAAQWRFRRDWWEDGLPWNAIVIIAADPAIVNDTQRWSAFCETLAKRDGTPYDRADPDPDEYNVSARFYCAYSDGTPVWPIDWGTEGEYLGFRLY